MSLRHCISESNDIARLEHGAVQIWQRARAEVTNSSATPNLLAIADRLPGNRSPATTRTMLTGEGAVSKSEKKYAIVMIKQNGRKENVGGARRLFRPFRTLAGIEEVAVRRRQRKRAEGHLGSLNCLTRSAVQRGGGSNGETRQCTQRSRKQGNGANKASATTFVTLTRRYSTGEIDEEARVRFKMH